MGDSIASNLFMLGYAFQKGLIPLGEPSIARAIEPNKQAFLWGRRAAVNPEQVERVATPTQPVVVHLPQSLDVLIARRVAFLGEYRSAAYARRYEAFFEKVRRAEEPLGAGAALARAVAEPLFKLMAYKDEYEVARLYTSGAFKERLNAVFEGNFRLKFHLAPPLLARRDARGPLVKNQYGAWIWPAFEILARLKFLRGTPFDIFGRTEERRMERQLIQDYQTSIEAALKNLNANKLTQTVELAALLGLIRGFGHVKLESVLKVRALAGRDRGGADGQEI